MVAGSRLSMVRSVSAPRPSFRCAMGMIQLVEKNLSHPRGPVCCTSATKASPWNMNVHEPFCFISIALLTDKGCASVPAVECCSIRSISDTGCMGIDGPPTWLIPGISIPVWVSCPKTVCNRAVSMTTAMTAAAENDDTKARTFPPDNPLPDQFETPQLSEFCGLDAEVHAVGKIACGNPAARRERKPEFSMRKQFAGGKERFPGGRNHSVNRRKNGRAFSRYATLVRSWRPRGTSVCMPRARLRDCRRRDHMRKAEKTARQRERTQAEHLQRHNLDGESAHSLH